MDCKEDIECENIPNGFEQKKNIKTPFRSLGNFSRVRARDLVSLSGISCTEQARSGDGH